jgi:hypothetical protein
MNTLTTNMIRYAIGFGIGAILVLTGLSGGCATVRGLAHDISVMTATMAEDPHQQTDHINFYGKDQK